MFLEPSMLTVKYVHINALIRVINDPISMRVMFSTVAVLQDFVSFLASLHCVFHLTKTK